MACHRPIDKPICWPMLVYCIIKINEVWKRFEHFHSRKCPWKCHLQNGGHRVSASVCSTLNRICIYVCFMYVLVTNPFSMIKRLHTPPHPGKSGFYIFCNRICGQFAGCVSLIISLIILKWYFVTKRKHISVPPCAVLAFMRVHLPHEKSVIRKEYPYYDVVMGRDEHLLCSGVSMYDLLQTAPSYVATIQWYLPLQSTSKTFITFLSR